eukprot:7128398-Heterocapsa_arctica.AAC.1
MIKFVKIIKALELILMGLLRRHPTAYPSYPPKKKGPRRMMNFIWRGIEESILLHTRKEGMGKRKHEPPCHPEPDRTGKSTFTSADELREGEDLSRRAVMEREALIRKRSDEPN